MSEIGDAVSRRLNNDVSSPTMLDPAEREQFLTVAKLVADRPSQFLYELAPFKQALTARRSLADAFAVFRELLNFPANSTIEYLPVKSLYEVARRHASVFVETGPSGIAFTAHPPRVIGAGDQRAFECVTRSLYFACLPECTVRGRSGFIEFRGSALLDFQGHELQRVDEQVVLDLPVLKGSKDGVWMCSSRGREIDLDEAFSLLGPHSPQFGHWIWEYIPKYIAAAMSARISRVPVLIDAHMPETHREFLRMILSRETEIVEVPLTATVNVRRLWCAPRLFFIPIYPKAVDPVWIPYRTAPPDRFASVIAEMLKRMSPSLPPASGPERIFLARKDYQARKLVNYSAIERRAKQAGFMVVYPQDLDFAAQIGLVRGARYILGQGGSAMLLSFFARPGTKLCILSSVNIFRSTSYTCLLEKLGIETTILTGPVTREDSPYSHTADYTILEETFSAFLRDWQT